MAAAWDPRGPDHVAGGVRRGGSALTHRGQWRLLVSSLGFTVADAKHDLTLTLIPGLKDR